MNLYWIKNEFENLYFLELWSARNDRCRISRCQNDVTSCQMTAWRRFFIKNFRICLSSQYLPCEIISSNLHAPKWNGAAQVARWLTLQVPDWRHLALYDAMTSDFEKNHREHFSYQYLACVKFSSWLEHQRWTYCCFHFCIDYEICRNQVHLRR